MYLSCSVKWIRKKICGWTEFLNKFDVPLESESFDINVFLQLSDEYKSAVLKAAGIDNDVIAKLIEIARSVSLVNINFEFDMILFFAYSMFLIYVDRYTWRPI